MKVVEGCHRWEASSQFQKKMNYSVIAANIVYAANLPKIGGLWLKVLTIFSLSLDNFIFICEPTYELMFVLII